MTATLTASRLSTEKADVERVHWDYIEHRIDGEEAYFTLYHCESSMCQLMAGRVALELAYFNADTSWITSAQFCLSRAAKNPRLKHGMRARAVLSQVPVYESIVRTRSLPKDALARYVYEETVEFAAGVLCRSLEPNQLKDNHRIAAAGLLSELAPLILAQRYAIQSGIDPSTWFGTLALLSEDHGREFAPWDLSIFTDHGDEAPQVTYPLQIKSSQEQRFSQARPSPKEPENYKKIFVHPQLALEPCEPWVAAHIAQEALVEMQGSDQYTLNLNKRQETLLELIG